MKLEDQVCSLQLSKRLKELGVKQDSLFCYREWRGPKGSTFNTSIKLSFYKGSINNCNIGGTYTYYCAFTSSELLELIPDYIYVDYEGNKPLYSCCHSDIYGSHIVITKNSGYYTTLQDGSNSQFGETENLTSDNNAANSLAKMLINLIENSLIKIDH